MANWSVHSQWPVIVADWSSHRARQLAVHQAFNLHAHHRSTQRSVMQSKKPSARGGTHVPMGTGVRGDDAQTDGNAGMACRTDCSGLRGSPLA